MSKHISLHPVARAIFAQRWPALASLLVPGLALAGPTGGSVVAGQIGITTPGAGTTVINQGSQSAIINWQQFSIGGNEYVIFNQPNASAAVLNRVVGGAPSEILGNLSANGRVFLINPQGVIFGKGAQVDVGSLVATTMNIADQDFLAGRYVFANGTQAPISNAGVIKAANGGFVVLAGDYVNNTGVIQAKLGDVVLASGSAMTLDLVGDGLISLNVDQRALSDRAGVSNLGEIAAQGGSVVMTAKVARSLAATAVNNSGVIKAQGISERGGDIFLTADGGDMVNAGTLDVSGTNGHDAGRVRIHGDRDITLASGSKILATGASGGDVRAVAERHLSVERGTYTDVGRQSNGGKGGFVEYSGHKSVSIDDIVHLGEHGNYLIDPTDMTIGYGGNDGANISQFTLESQLQNMSSSSTWTIDASSGTGTDAGNIRVLGDLSGNTLNGHSSMAGYGGNLTLIAGPSGSVTFDDQTTLFDIAGDITIHGGTSGGSQTLGNLHSGGAILIDGHGGINSGYLHAATGLSVTSDTGDIVFTNIALSNSDGSSAITQNDIDASITATGGSISGQFIFVDNSLSATSFGAGMAATLHLDAKTGITISGTNPNTGSGIGVYGGGGRGAYSISTTASATLNAGGAVHITGPVTVTGTDYHYVNPNNSTDEIHAGGAEFQVTGDTVAIDGTAQDGSLQITGEGIVTADITGHNGITLGNAAHVSASAATINTPGANGQTISLQYGYANVFLTADDGNSSQTPTVSAVKTGNISAQGPNAIIAITGGSVEVGAAGNTAADYGVSADANTVTGLTQVKDANSNVLYHSNAGTAQISVLTGGGIGGKGILTHGGIAADGPSSQVNLFASQGVEVGGTLLVTGHGYDQGGDASLSPFQSGPTAPIASFNSDAPFHLRNGSFNWGGAQVFIGGAPTNQGGNNQASAGHVHIAGDLDAHGVGKVNAQIVASNANIDGDVSLFASKGTLSGTFTSQETINGFLYDVTRVIGDTVAADGSVTGTASFGGANFDMKLSSNTADTTIGGKLDVRGNSASASINGGHSATIGGDVTVGGFRNADPQFDTPPPVYAEQVSYAAHVVPTDTLPPPPVGPAIASHSESITGDISSFSVGFEQALTGNFSTGIHSITVEGTGIAAVGIDANGITTGQISITGHQGAISFQPAGGTATPTTFNDTALLLHAASGTANTGGVSVTGTGGMHVGGKFNAGAGQVALQTPGSIDSTIPGALLGVNHPLDSGSFPLVPDPDRALGALDVATTGSIFFKFGADSALSGLSLVAGNNLTVDGDINAAGLAHGLQAGASPTLKGGAGSVNIHNVKLGATGTAAIQATGGAIDIQHSTFGLTSGAPAGSTLAINAVADQAVTANASTFNVNSLSLKSNTDNVTIQGGANLIANTVQLISTGAGKNITVDGSLITTNGGVATGNGDLKIQSAGSFTVNNSTIADLSGGLGLISSNGNAAASSISSSVLNFSGPLQVTVTGTGSSLSITGGHIGPSTIASLLTGKLVAAGAGNVSLSSSGNLTLNTTVNANQLTVAAGNTLHLAGTATAGKTLLSGVNGVIADAPGFTLTANSLGVQSTLGAINLLQSNLVIGNGVTTLGLDPTMVSYLGVFKPTSTGPNAAFDSAGRVDLGNLTVGGDYLYVRGTQAVFNGNLVHSGNPLFYNFVPTSLTSGISTIGIENFVNSYMTTNGPNAVLTLAFGSSGFSGPVMTGNNVGTTPTNFVFVTTNGNIQGYNAIQTKGQVAILNGGVLSIRGQTPPPTTPPPPPAIQQQGKDAGFAVSNSPPSENDPNKETQAGDINGANGTDNGQDQIENHTHDGVLDKSCT